MIDPVARFHAALLACPLVAILRGLRPDEAEAIGTALIEAGIRIIEVPLNSPEPFASITRLAEIAGDTVLVGAGTVLDTEAVARVAAAGGELVVSPATDIAVIGAAVAAGMVALPGFLTPGEAFAALAAGAHGLKYFPAEAGSPAALKAMRAVLPRGTLLLPVGGITPESIPAWRDAGADGFGIGGGLFKPGMTANDVAAGAALFVAAAAPGA